MVSTYISKNYSHELTPYRLTMIGDIEDRSKSDYPVCVELVYRLPAYKGICSHCGKHEYLYHDRCMFHPLTRFNGHEIDFDVEDEDVFLHLMITQGEYVGQRMRKAFGSNMLIAGMRIESFEMRMLYYTDIPGKDIDAMMSAFNWKSSVILTPYKRHKDEDFIYYDRGLPHEIITQYDPMWIKHQDYDMGARNAIFGHPNADGHITLFARGSQTYCN